MSLSLYTRTRHCSVCPTPLSFHRYISTYRFSPHILLGLAPFKTNFLIPAEVKFLNISSSTNMPAKRKRTIIPSNETAETNISLLKVEKNCDGLALTRSPSPLLLSGEDSPLSSLPESQVSDIEQEYVNLSEMEKEVEKKEKEEDEEVEEEMTRMKKKKKKIVLTEGKGKKAKNISNLTIKTETKMGKKTRSKVVSDGEGDYEITQKKKKPRSNKVKDNDMLDCDGTPTSIQQSTTSVERPPPVNSDYLPLPWKGRLGYACLNTYLRTSNPPIFCSRTCRIDTILKHGKEGQKYVESLGLANAKDLKKLIEFNERYGIKFLRISSEMFPFASHEVYGYSLEFAKETLAEAGATAMKYGHRLSMHPGQFTQLGSPRKEVVTASVRDLEYHNQLLKFLNLSGQTDKDAVLILHMGGTFGDKQATLQRFRENYTNLLSDEIKARLVLENDDMCWSVHELLPICKELNIPLVLDWHHHNIIHDPSMREGTLDILKLISEIKETWTRKGITQKQHYSEPKEDSGNTMQRRRHSARVKTLPPCEPDMDLMIEAKDKEQSVFELMRMFKLDGYEKINDVIPHERQDENKPEPKKKTKKKKMVVNGKSKGEKKKKVNNGETEQQIDEVEEEEDGDDNESSIVQQVVPEEVGMGGPEGRVYWPEGMEHWLSPPKKVRKQKEIEETEDTLKTTQDGDGTLSTSENAEGDRINSKGNKRRKVIICGRNKEKTEGLRQVEQIIDTKPGKQSSNSSTNKRAKKKALGLPAIQSLDEVAPPPHPQPLSSVKRSSVSKTITTRKKTKSAAVDDECGVGNDVEGLRRSRRAKKEVVYN